MEDAPKKGLRTLGFNAEDVYKRQGLNEACEVYEVDASDAGPVSEDEDILNYDDVDDPDAYV